MDDLRRRFASLDRMPAPDLWDAIERRAAAPEQLARVTGVVSPVSMRSRRSTSRSLVLILAAAAVLVALVAGAVAIGSRWPVLPAIVPALVVSPSPAASPTSATPLPPISPAPSRFASDARVRWIVFGVAGVSSDHNPRLWAMRADGSGAHEIADGGPVAWSDDGTRLLVLGRAFPADGSILVADVGDDIGPFVDTRISEPSAEQWEAFDFAPDGERVVFMRKSKCASRSTATGSASSQVVLATYVAETAGANCYVLSILDLRTRELTDLDKTLVKDQTKPQTGSLELPAWSPDGTKIAYTRIDQPDRPDGVRDLWVVNADGTDPARVELAADISVQEPRWSPDGTRISFTSDTQQFSGAAESAVFVADVATGRLDRVTIGSDSAARQLSHAEWLDNFHLRVQGRSPGDTNRFWLVSLDVIPHEARVLVDLTESLAAIPSPVTSVTAPGEPGRTFFWQPVREGQP